MMGARRKDSGAVAGGPQEQSNKVCKRARDGAGIAGCLREDCAQATVEMVVVVPVLIVLALISYNVMMFLSAVARFDRVAPDIVLAHAASPAGECGNGASVAGVVAERLEDAMEPYDVEIEVTCDGQDETGAGAVLSLVGGQRTYRCVMGYVPWPTRLSIAGVSLGAPLMLEHAREVTVDPWRPGVVM